MADRNKKDKNFDNNPFKSLKGLSVSEPKKKAAAPDRKGGGPPAGTVSGPKEELPEEEVFAREMGRLGVTARNRGDHDPLAKEELPVQAKKAAPAPGAPVSEEELFLSSLGKLDSVFRDEFPEEEPPGEGSASARRMRQLRRGKLVPEDELDLHGMTREEARERVRFFLENAVHHGRKAVLVVTGRGLGSAGEPVLRAEVERLLSQDLRELVLEWGRAPRQYGGDGALVVFPRGRRE